MEENKTNTITENVEISNFKTMVEANELTAKRWQRALVFTNLFWAIVLAMFILFAYMSPDTTYQTQDFTDQTQTQAAGDVNAIESE